MTTAGGTTYAFQLRRGIRYSNGTLVKASDFRRAFERPFRAGYPTGGRGAPRGVRRLREAAAELRSQPGHPDGRRDRDDRLPPPTAGAVVPVGADPRPPIPRGTPDRNMGTRPVPSTGPYMIESYVPGRALTLVRNPYFRVWSRAARPDGFPDEIQFRLAVPGPQWRHGRQARAGRRRTPSRSRQGRTSRRLRSLERATRRRSTCTSSRRRSSSSSIRHVLPSTMFGCGAPSTTRSTAAPFQGRTGARSSPSRPASPARREPWPSSATAPTLSPRAGRASGRRLT